MTAGGYGAAPELLGMPPEPDLVDAAVEESLRFNSPVHSTALRLAPEPLDIGGPG